MLDWDKKEKERTDAVKVRLDESLKIVEKVLSDLHEQRDKNDELITRTRNNLQNMLELRDQQEEQILKGEDLRTKILDMKRDLK